MICSSILLRALKATLSTPYGVRGRDDIIYPAPDVAYADDLNTLSATRRGLQAQADTVSAFPTLFGLRNAANKPRLGLFGGTPSVPPETTTIHHLGWIPKTLSVRRGGPHPGFPLQLYRTNTPHRTQLQWLVLVCHGHFLLVSLRKVSQACGKLG